jgi:PHD/YefM family antitoxin component YafN of YafNO toxin-antitoxin module
MARRKNSLSTENLAALMEQAIDEDGAVIIRRPGRKDLVVMPFDRLREMDTAAYLLASPTNRKRLLSAIREARRGGGRRMTVAQLRKHVGLTN